MTQYKPEIKPGDLIEETVKSKAIGDVVGDVVYIYIVNSILATGAITTSEYIYKYGDELKIIKMSELLNPKSFIYKILKRNATKKDLNKIIFMHKTGIMPT